MSRMIGVGLVTLWFVCAAVAAWLVTSWGRRDDEAFWPYAIAFLLAYVIGVAAGGIGLSILFP